MSAPVLSTSRFTLHAVTPRLIHQLYDTLDKAAVMTYFGYDEAAYQKHLSMHELGMETHNLSQFYFLIRDQEQRPLGECGFHTWNRAHRRAELFYLLRQESDRGKGYMSEILPEVLNYGFEELELHRIAALVAPWNTPSVKLLQRFGFSMEGIMREDYRVDGKNEDSACYSLLRWEWETRRLQG